MSPPVPDAELLIAPGCAHCPAVMTALGDLLKQGRLGRLDIVNVVAFPEHAAERGARGVPWIRIGPFELNGAHTPADLAKWVERAGSEAGMRSYLGEGLAGGELATVTAACRHSPVLLRPLLDLAADLETPFAVRIGVGAVLEDLAGQGMPTDAVQRMLEMTHSDAPQVRADAAHFLGLVATGSARARLQQLLDDPDHEVREIATESLAALG